MKNVWRYESPGENKPRMSASIPASAAAIPRALPAGREHKNVLDTKSTRAKTDAERRESYEETIHGDTAKPVHGADADARRRFCPIGTTFIKLPFSQP